METATTVGLEILTTLERLERVTAWLAASEDQTLERLREQYCFMARKLAREEQRQLWREALAGYYALNCRRVGYGTT